MRPRACPGSGPAGAPREVSRGPSRVAGGPWPRRFSAWQDLLSPAAAAVSVPGLGLPRGPALAPGLRSSFGAGFALPARGRGGARCGPWTRACRCRRGRPCFWGPVWWASRAVPRGGVGVARLPTRFPGPSVRPRRVCARALGRVNWLGLGAPFPGRPPSLPSCCGPRRRPSYPAAGLAAFVCVTATGAAMGLAVGPGFRFPPLPAPPLSLRARAPTPAASAVSGGCGLSEPPLPRPVRRGAAARALSAPAPSVPSAALVACVGPVGVACGGPGSPSSLGSAEWLGSAGRVSGLPHPSAGPAPVTG